jgi:transcriptional regulator NrdR family protein
MVRMKCPRCLGALKVTETKVFISYIARSRRCLNCDLIFHTTETINATELMTETELRRASTELQRQGALKRWRAMSEDERKAAMAHTRAGIRH